MQKYLDQPWCRRLLAAAAGLLLAAAFPRIGIAGFAWIAPALMLAAAHGRSGGAAFRLGFISGFTFALGSLYWLLLIPVRGFPILGWMALSAYVALYPALWVWLLSTLDSSSRHSAATADRLSTWPARLRWALTGAATWVALEMLRGRFLSGFPWNLLGDSQYQLTPLIQIAAGTGVYGVSFLVVWVSLSLYNATRAILQQPTRRFSWQAEIILPLVTVVTIYAVGYVRLRQPNPPDHWLNVTFVQPSIPQTMIWDTTENTNRFRQLLELTERALTNETDLLLWPEAALPDFSDANYAAITNLVATHHVWMIFGADDAEPKAHPTDAERYDYYNAAFLFNPAGEFVARYHKRNLVIFGEYIPLVQWLPFIKWFTPITGGFAAGTKPGNFEMNGWGETSGEPQAETSAGSQGRSPRRAIKTSPLICFEDVFPHLAREAATADTDFLVNITNDGWFGEGAEQWQHAAAGVFRAVENGLPLLRSCNNGLTCWIDGRGRIRQFLTDKSGSIYGAGFLTVQIPIQSGDQNRPATYYHRHGNVFGWACVGLALFVLLRPLIVRPPRR